MLSDMGDECQLIYNAIHEPNWDYSFNAKLCCGDCEKCRYNTKKREKNQLIYDIMMVKINCHFEDKKLMEIFNVTQEIIDIAKITWISGHFMTDILSGSIIIDANNYKQYLKNTI